MIKTKPHLKGLTRTNNLSKARRGCLRLDMNESVTGLPEGFVRRVLAGIGSESICMYPEYEGLKKAIARHNGIRPDEVCIANGSDAAIKYIFDAYIGRGDKVLLTDPTFAMYPVYCRIFGARPVITRYGPDLKFPYDAFMKGLTGAVKMAVIVNPNNPTGSVLKKKELLNIIKAARKKGVLVVVDEAYHYFYPETLIKEVGRFDNLIVLRTFSKLCGMAALRLGYAAADPAIINNLNKVKPTYDVNGLAASFAERLLAEPAMIRTLIRESNEGKRYLIERLSGSGINHEPGNANFVLIKCNGRAARLAKALAGKKILVGSGFKQACLKDYIRITVGDKDAMARFWEAFITIWRKKR